MTTQYGIGVTKNRFELFGIDDEDPLEVLKFHEREKEAKKKTKLCEKENKGKEAVSKPKILPSRKGIKETQNLKSHELNKGKEDNKSSNIVPRGYDRGERKLIGDNREDRNNRRNRNDMDFQRDDRGSDRPDRKEIRGNVSGGTPGPNNETNENITGGRGNSHRPGRIGSRGGGTSVRGSGTGRGGRGSIQGSYRGGAPTFENKSKREFEKQIVSDKSGEVNGTAVQPQEESNNWPLDKQETESNVETNGGVTTTETDEVGVPEEEPKELTLDEWKAMKAPRQKPIYNLRKAGEGEDLSQWKKMYALQKKKDGEEDDDDDEYEYESCEYPQRVGRQKHILDIDIHFKDTRIGGRSRGGRGTGRGGPRMGGRSVQTGSIPNILNEKHSLHSRDHKSAPKVDDEHDFPSLG